MRILIFMLLLLATPTASQNYEAEIECLAKNIYFESRGEPLEGQYAVAYVTLNRVLDSRWPDTICDVVYEPNQFSWTVNPNRPIREHDAWIDAQTIARSAYLQYHMMGVDNTDGAVYFNAGRRKTYHGDLTLVIGNHKFYM